MSSLQRPVIAVFVCLIVASPLGWAWAADRKILGVQVSPDLKRITIKCDSPAGKHSSFVIQRPQRLVLDLESTALGTVPTKIAVGREPINEIRLGFLNERARVAIDFGDSAVPPFKIEKVNNDIVVSLERGLAVCSPGAVAGGQRGAACSARYAQAASAKPANPRPDGAAIAVKHSGVANNMVYVELTNRKNPKQSYRLVIDVDPEAMQPRNATLSDSSGSLKKYEMTASTELSPESGG